MQDRIRRLEAEVSNSATKNQDFDPEAITKAFEGLESTLRQKMPAFDERRGSKKHRRRSESKKKSVKLKPPKKPDAKPRKTSKRRRAPPDA